MANWLVLTWKASFCNCFCWFALHFQEITYVKTQFSKGIFWRSFVEWKIEETFCFAEGWSHRSMAFAASCSNRYKFYYSYNYAILLLLLSLAQANKALNWPDASLFCPDIGSIRGRSIFLRSISLLLSKTKTSI